MAKAENALKGIGVTIRGETADELRGIEEIIDDVAGAWDRLSDSQRQAVSEAMAGTQRSSMFSALIENYEKVKELQTIGLGAEGELAEANQKRVESLKGIQGQLEVTKEALYATIISEEEMAKILKGTDSFLQGLTKLVAFVKNTAIPTFIALATIDLQMGEKSLILKGWDKLTDVVANVNKFRMSLYSLEGGFSLTANGMKALKAGVVGLAVALATYTFNAIKNLTPELDDLSSQLGELTSATNKFAESQKALENVKTDTSSMKEMVERINKLKEENGSWEEQQGLIKEVNSKLSEHASSYTTIQSTLENENLALETRIALLEREAEIASQKAQNEAVAKLYERDWMALGATDSEKMTNTSEQAVINLLASYNSLQDLQKRVADNNGQMTNQMSKDFEILSVAIESQKNKVEGVAIELSNYYMNIKQLFDSGAISEGQFDYFMQYYNKGIADLQRIVDETDLDLNLQLDIQDFMNKTPQVKDEVVDIVNEINALSTSLSSLETEEAKTSLTSLVNSINTLKDGSEEAKTVLEQLHSTFADMPSEVDTLAEAIDYLNGKLDDTKDSTNDMKDLNQTYLEAVEAIAEAKNLLDSFEEGLTASELRSLFDSELLTDYNGALTDTVSIQEHLNNKIAEMEEASNEAYNNMLKQDENFWNTKIKNSETWANHENELQNQITQLGAQMLGIQEQDFIDFINAKGGYREVDLTNAQNFADAEGKTNNSLINQMLQWYSQYFNEKGVGRSVDMQNILTFLNEHGGAEAKTIDQLVQMWNEYYKAKKSEILDSVSKFRGQIGDYGDLGNISTEELKKLTALEKDLADLEKSAQSMGNFFDSINTSFSNITSSLGLGSTSVGKVNNSTSSNKASSSSSKEVADLELTIDRYYALNDAISDVTNALEANRREQEKAEGKQRLAKLFEEELKLLEKQKKAYEDLHKEQLNQAQDYRNAIANAGFSMDGEGNITNYQTQLQNMVNYANSLKGEAKSAQIEYVKSISSIIDAYTTLTNSTIPDTESTIDSLTQSIKNLNKEHEEALKYLNDLKDAYYNLNKAVKEIDNALELNQAKQENATPEERIKLMEEEIALMKERQDLIKEQEEAYKKSAKDMAEQLSAQGIKFDANGKIINYDEVIDNLINIANGLVGTSQEEAQEELEELLDLIEEYDDIMLDTLPNLSKEWVDYANAIKEAEKTKADLVTSIQKDITSAIENEYNKRYSALKSALQKEKDLLNQQYDEEDHQNTLAKKNQELAELQKAIDDLSRDSSDAGQMKLKDLLQQYKDKQEEINEYIRDYEKEQGNNRFDEEMEKLDEELEEILSPENLANMVNQALVDGFVTIEGEVVELSALMTDWLNETGDGLYALGDILREELINKLQTAQGLIADMGILSTTSRGIRSTSLSSNDIQALMDLATDQKSTENNITIGSFINVEGNITEDVLPQVETMIDEFKNDFEDIIIEKLAEEMSKY